MLPMPKIYLKTPQLLQRSLLHFLRLSIIPPLTPRMTHHASQVLFTL